MLVSHIEVHEVLFKKRSSENKLLSQLLRKDFAGEDVQCADGGSIDGLSEDVVPRGQSVLGVENGEDHVWEVDDVVAGEVGPDFVDDFVENCAWHVNAGSSRRNDGLCFLFVVYFAKLELAREENIVSFVQGVVVHHAPFIEAFVIVSENDDRPFGLVGCQVNSEVVVVEFSLFVAEFQSSHFVEERNVDGSKSENPIITQVSVGNSRDFVHFDKSDSVDFQVAQVHVVLAEETLDIC